MPLFWNCFAKIKIIVSSRKDTKPELESKPVNSSEEFFNVKVLRQESNLGTFNDGVETSHHEVKHFFFKYKAFLLFLP